jgi:hypothetical protein
MANNSEKSFKDLHAGTNIWRLVRADKFMTNRIVPGYEAVKKDDWKLLDNDYNARRAYNLPNKFPKVSVNYKGSNPKPYDQLYNKNSATNSSGNMNQNRSKSLPSIVSSTTIDTELPEYLNVTVSKCKQTMTTGLKAAPLRLTSRDLNPPPIQRRGITIEPEVQEGDTIITNPVIEARALLDTGSLPGNFITVDL